jgi:negative regulator of sigma E activity
MKTFEEITGGVYLVESEPGDGTRYSYFVYMDFDEFLFMPFRSTFRFPQRLNYFDVQNITDNDGIKIADKENCNPYTLMECIRTMNELRKMG